MATVDVWLTTGQSNMAGRGDSALSPTPDPALCWEWDEDGSLDALADPGVAGGGYVAATGSCLPSFVSAFTAQSARPCVVVRGAIGGTALLASNASANGDWSATGTRFTNAANRALAALADIATAGHTVARVNVLWSQGEQDAVVGNDLGTYQAATEALVTRFRTALGWPSLRVFVCRTGLKNSPGPGWQVVRDAQDAACAADVGLVMAYTRAIDFFDLGWMKADNIHYAQTGLNDMGATAGALAATYLGEEPPPTPPPGPTTGAHRTSAADLLFSALA